MDAFCAFCKGRPGAQGAADVLSDRAPSFFDEGIAVSGALTDRDSEN
jgi:hypothetical protein